MKKSFIYLILVFFSFFSIALGQETEISNNEISLTDEENTILFSIAVLIVIGIIIYITRDVILRKKTVYDKGDFASQKDRDYEKYHSEWSGDSERLGHKSTEDDEEFRKAVDESSLPNYYQILGLEKDATPNEIKQRFRKLAKELHPDKTTAEDAENKMIEINKAYEILSDSERREIYDKYLKVS